MNQSASDASSAIINGRNTSDILIQKLFHDQQHRFNHQSEVDQGKDVSIRDQLLKMNADNSQQFQSSILGDMIPNRIETTNLNIRLPVRDISDGHH